MSAETSAYSALSGAGAVTALVDTRIYPDFVPQEKTLPAIAIARTETEYVTTIHSGTPVAAEVTLDVHCMAATRAGAEALADAALAALGAATFTLQGRTPQFDPEGPELFSTVLTVNFWE